VQQYSYCFNFIYELHPKFFQDKVSKGWHPLKNDYLFLDKNYNIGKTIIDFICENNLMYNNTEEIETLFKLQKGN
jgi:hypothetical protein